MWTYSHSTKVKDMTAEHLWKVWTDVNQWHTWQADIDSASLNEPFAVNSKIKFRPKGGPNIHLELVEIEPNKLFTDLTRFPLAKMYDSHEIIQRGSELEVKTTIKIHGLLSFVWRKLVAENIAKDLDNQTQNLIKRARELQ